jgi:Amt family ammonium transporter
MKRIGFLSLITMGLAAFSAAPAFAEEPSVADTLINLAYSIDTFYFLMSGALVMWMACGFAMLEAGLVRSKNVVEILTKNIALYAIASIMYMLVGYNIMYGGGPNGFIPGFSFLLGADNAVDAVLSRGGDIYYSSLSDFFFQVVFVGAAMSIVSGAVAERMKLWSLPKE